MRFSQNCDIVIPTLNLYRSQIEGYSRLSIFRKFSILPAVIWASPFIKGQIKLKARLARHRFFQKTNKGICFVCRAEQKSKKKTNSFIHVLGESMACQSLFCFFTFNIQENFQPFWVFLPTQMIFFPSSPQLLEPTL